MVFNANFAQPLDQLPLTWSSASAGPLVFRPRSSVKGFETTESSKQNLSHSQLPKGFEWFYATFALSLDQLPPLPSALPADPRTPSSFGQIHVTIDQLHPDFAYFTNCCHESKYSTMCAELRIPVSLQAPKQVTSIISNTLLTSACNTTS